jgi:hypothetical protein
VSSATFRQADLQLVHDELVRGALSSIPTCYGRLVYLTSLRDPNTGRYDHYLFEEMFGEGLAQAGLEAAHVRSYREWVAMNLEQKQADLYLYLVSLSSDSVRCCKRGSSPHPTAPWCHCTRNPWSEKFFSPTCKPCWPCL